MTWAKFQHGPIGGKCLLSSRNVIFLKWEQENLKYNHEMRCEKLESVQCVKDLGVTVVSNIKFSQQCKEAVGKANRMLGFINNFFLSRIKM